MTRIPTNTREQMTSKYEWMSSESRTPKCRALCESSAGGEEAPAMHTRVQMRVQKRCTIPVSTRTHAPLTYGISSSNPCYTAVVVVERRGAQCRFRVSASAMHIHHNRSDSSNAIPPARASLATTCMLALTTAGARPRAYEQLVCISDDALRPDDRTEHCDILRRQLISA
jgi:hypothetical protein